ncbi:MAG: filamentous hemagglutinin N-terminal domain-containing protein, partial [Cyanobacteria bacterium J06632_22]
MLNKRQFLLGTLLLLASGWPIGSAQALPIPDDTLGAGNQTSVDLGETSNDIPAYIIRGGYQYDGNIFHSFEQFNIAVDESVYFVSPKDARAIFTRVTGGDVSNLFGTLGVDGGADLYFLNPAGVVFGPDISLDIAGGLTVSTEPSVLFQDGSIFSVDGTTDSSLLTISVPLGLPEIDYTRPVPGESSASIITQPSADPIQNDDADILGSLNLFADTIRLT